MTLEELYREGLSGLKPGEASALEARALLLGAARLSELDYAREPGRPSGRRLEARFRKWVRRRKNGEPLAYVTGRKEFWSLPLRIRPGVFIPRPETELLVELVLDRMSRAEPAILDLGTGSGCVALALASELPGARITAVDVSRTALRVARLNAGRLAPESAGRRGGRRLTFIRSAFFSALSRMKPQPRFDVIVSNPPYVAEDEWERLEAGIRDFEPRRAFVPGDTGLEAVRRIIGESPGFLKPGGWLVLEIGSGQGEAVPALFDGRWRDVACHSDLQGLPRAVSARWMPPGIVSPV